MDHAFGDFIPPHIASKAEETGVKKAELAVTPLLLLSVLAGAFIGLGGNFFTITMTGSQTMPWGVAKMLGGVAFSLGLILVVVGGAELFTGNNLIVIALASRKTTLVKLLRNWVWVYLGNFVGSLLTAYFILLSGQYLFGGGAVGATALSIAEHKCKLTFTEIFFLAVYCNALVCLAVWLSMGARTISGKILAIVFPITAFIAGGFEHCVANMYLIPLGIFIKSAAASTVALSGPLSEAVQSASHVTWSGFLHNLLPATLGNIVGGALMVGAVYWLVYCKPLAYSQAAATLNGQTEKTATESPVPASWPVASANASRQ